MLEHALEDRLLDAGVSDVEILQDDTGRTFGRGQYSGSQTDLALRLGNEFDLEFEETEDGTVVRARPKF